MEFDDFDKQVQYMYKFISTVLDNMGNWFGLIFKIAVPIVVMYRPIKTFIFSFVLAGVYLGVDSYLSSDLGVIIFGVIYAAFILLLIFFPKIASAVEFFLIAWYFAFLVLMYSGFLDRFFKDVSHFVSTYSGERFLVAAFLAGKILFFFFVKMNRKEYDKKQMKNEQFMIRS